MPVTTTTVLTENTLNLLQFPIYYSRIYAFLEQFLHHNTHYYGKICNFALCMKHRRLDKYVTLYNVCKEGGKVVYNYVETLPQQRLQDRNLKEFYRQIEEHGYDVLSPSDKEYERVVKTLNAVSKKDAMKDDMSSYSHYKPEETCTCGRWIFFEHLPYYDEKELKDIVYPKTARRKAEEKPVKIKEKISSVRVPAFQKESVKQFLDWLKETNASDASIYSALRDAKYAMESKAEKYAESPTLQSMADDLKKQIALLEELEDKLPRL